MYAFQNNCILVQYHSQYAYILQLLQVKGLIFKFHSFLSNHTID